MTLPLSIQDARNNQTQFQLADSADINRGRHLVQFGGDFRWLTANLWTRPYTVITQYLDLSAMENHMASESIVAQREPVSIGMAQSSAVIEDTWKLSSRLTFTAGMRWQLNPPPGASSQVPAFWAMTSSIWNDPLSYRSSSNGSTLWKTGLGDLAPRLGAAWKPWSQRNLAVRGAVGVRYELGLGPVLSSAPLVSVEQLFTTLPSSAGGGWQLVSTFNPSSATGPPAYSVVASFCTPHIVEWNISVEQELSSHAMLSLAYVGSAGQVLPMEERATGGNTVITNRASSSYNALQASLRHRMRAGFQGSLSASWAHSIDNASHSEFYDFAPLVEYADTSINRGNSDFDVRLSLFGLLTWQPGNCADGRSTASGERALVCRSTFTVPHKAWPSALCART